MWRWINQHDMSVGQRKILSPRQESNPWPPEHGASSLSTELRELVVSKLGHLAEFICDRCLAYCQDEHCQSQCKWLRRLNFKLGNEFLKRELINMTWAWDKEKFWVPDRNRTHDLLDAVKCLHHYCIASSAHQIVLITVQVLILAIPNQGRSGIETVFLAFCASYGHLHSKL